MKQDIHLRELWKVVRKHRLVVFCTLVVAICGSLAINLLTVPLYEARTRVVIERGESGRLTERSGHEQRDLQFYDTQVELFRSRAVADRVVERLSLEEEGALARLTGPPSFLSRLAGRLTPSDTEILPADIGARRDKAAKIINSGLKIRAVENSRMLSISIIAPDPEMAALVANATVAAYLEEIGRMKEQSSLSTMGWMNRSAQEEENKLRQAERQLQDYMGKNSVLTMENRVAVIPEKLSQITTQLVNAEARRKELEALHLKIGQIRKDPATAETVFAITSDQALQSLRAQILAAEQGLLELSSKYGPKHPIMLKGQADLDVLLQKKDQEITRIARSIRHEYELALTHEQNLRSQLEETRAEAIQMNEKFVRYQALQAEVDTNRKLYDALMLRMKDEGISKENQSVNLWVMETAGIPLRPAKPQKALNLMLGSLLGLFGGLGLAFFREHLDNTVRNPDEIESIFQLPVLGTISRCDQKQHIERIILKEPLSPFAENYKALRTSVLAALGDRHGKAARLMVTSSLAGEGKTSTSANLAMALAQGELRVVLIDADLRKPRLHEIFTLRGNSGLSTLLSATVTEEGVDKTLRAGPLPNLAILPAGKIPPNPSELLLSNRMDAILDILSERFDMILLDSPPILAVEDSRILCRRLDGLLLVTRAHQTTLEAAGQALKLLTRIKAPMLGLVINALDQRKTDYYYHHQYYTAYQPEKLEVRRVAK